MYLDVLRKDDEGRFQPHMVCRSANTLQSLWEYSARAFRFEWFAVGCGTLVLTDGRGNVHGLSAESGKLRWVVDPSSTGLFKDQAEVDDLPNTVRGYHNFNRALGFPAIHQGVAVVPMLANHLIGINIQTGEIVWKEFLQDTHHWIRHAYGDTIYTFGGGGFEGRNMVTGEKTFNLQIDTQSFEALSGKKRPSAAKFVCSETHLFVVDGINALFYSVDRMSGKVEWVQEPKIPRLSFVPYMYVANGRLYLGEVERLTVFEGADGYVPPVETMEDANE